MKNGSHLQKIDVQTSLSVVHPPEAISKLQKAAPHPVFNTYMNNKRDKTSFCYWSTKINAWNKMTGNSLKRITSNSWAHLSEQGKKLYKADLCAFLLAAQKFTLSSLQHSLPTSTHTSSLIKGKFLPQYEQVSWGSLRTYDIIPSCLLTWPGKHDVHASNKLEINTKITIIKCMYNTIS